MPPKQRFSEGERVLCFHGPLIYEAKCLRVKAVDKQTKYFIHYFGWKKNWDEWVSESRVLKFNDANLQKQKELLNQHELQMRSKKTVKGQKKKSDKDRKEPIDEKEKKEENNTSRPSTPQREKGREKSRSCNSGTPQTPTPTPTQNDAEPSTSKKKKKDVESASPTASINYSPPSPTEPLPTPKKKKKRGDKGTPPNESPSKKKKKEPAVESEETYMTKVEVKIKIPEELKPVLVDDWDLVCRQKKLLNIPAKPNVEQIFEDYLLYKRHSKSTTAAKLLALKDVTTGMKDYFNTMLGAQLLYKFERPQYAEVLESNAEKDMSQLYGSVHLLRLFVKIGPMFAYSQLDEKCVSVLTAQIHDFLRFMVKRSSLYFNLNEYGTATPEYHRRAM